MASSRSSAEQQERLAQFARLVRESPHNLLSKQGVEELETRHIPESVRFALALPPAAELLDLGSGGGLPGMVIAIVRPDIHVHLLDATRKKTEFLAATAEALGLEVEVHNGRVEALSTGVLAARFPIVVARALARLDRLAALGAPYLTAEGVLYAIKGERWREEVTELHRPDIEVFSTPEVLPLTGPDGPLVVGLRRARSGAQSAQTRGAPPD